MNLHLTHIIDQLVSSLSLVKQAGKIPGANSSDRKTLDHANNKQFATALKAASTPKNLEAKNEVKESLPDTKPTEIDKSDSSKKVIAEHDHDINHEQDSLTDQTKEASANATPGVELLTPPLLAFLNIHPQIEDQPDFKDQPDVDSSVSGIADSTVPTETQSLADTQNLVQALSEFLTTSVRPDQNQPDQNLIGVTLNPELKTALGTSLSNEDIAAIEARVRQKIADATQDPQPKLAVASQPTVADAFPEIDKANLKLSSLETASEGSQSQTTEQQTSQAGVLQPFLEVTQRLLSLSKTGDHPTAEKASLVSGAAETTEKTPLTLNTALKAAPIIQGILQIEKRDPVQSNPYITQSNARQDFPRVYTPQTPSVTPLDSTPTKETHSTFSPEKLKTDKPDAISLEDFSLDATIARGQIESTATPIHSLTFSGSVSLDQAIQTPTAAAISSGPVASAPVNWTHDSVVDQVQDKISQFQVNSARKEISFNLTPDDLGTVRVHLNSTSNHQLSARFIVTSVEAQSALENNVHQLKQSLEQQGVRVDQVNIVLAGAAESKVAHGNNASNQQDFSGNQQQDSAKEQTRDFDQRNQQNQARQELASQFQVNLFRSSNQDIQYDWNNLTQPERLEQEQSQQEQTIAPQGTINLTI